MPWYRVPIKTTTIGWVDVEAEDRQAAVDVALDEKPDPLGICCSGYGKPWKRDEGTWELDPSAEIEEL